MMLKDQQIKVYVLHMIFKVILIPYIFKLFIICFVKSNEKLYGMFSENVL
jgi:hypothetical protein